MSKLKLREVIIPKWNFVLWLLIQLCFCWATDYIKGWVFPFHLAPKMPGLSKLGVFFLRVVSPGRQDVAGAGTLGWLIPILLHFCGCAFHSLFFCGMNFRVDVTFFHMVKKVNWLSLPLGMDLNKAYNQEIKHAFLNQMWNISYYLFNSKT